MRKVINILIDLYPRVGVAMMLIFVGCALALFVGAFAVQVVTIHLPEPIEKMWMYAFSISFGFLIIHAIVGTSTLAYGNAKQWIAKRFA